MINALGFHDHNHFGMGGITFHQVERMLCSCGDYFSFCEIDGFRANVRDLDTALLFGCSLVDNCSCKTVKFRL